MVFGMDVDGLQTDDLAGGPVLQEIAWFDDGRCRLVDSISSRSEVNIFCPVFCVINGTFYYLCSLNMMML